MAVDATGTPTTKGISKFNTAADSPSGVGFNNAMDDIDTLLDSCQYTSDTVAANEGVFRNAGNTAYAYGLVATANIADNAVDGTKIAIGSDAVGDIVYYNGTDWVILAAGTDNYVLEAAGAAAPAWKALGGDISGAIDGATVTDLTITSEAQGTILYFNGTNWVVLGVGTSGEFLQTQGAGANPQWATQGGAELDYVEATSNTSVTATAEGSGNTSLTGASVSYDGSTVIEIEAYFPNIIPGTNWVRTAFFEDGSTMGIVHHAQSQGGSKMATRITPSNASHTYSVRHWVDAGTGTMAGGAGGAGAFEPCFMRITQV